MRERGPQEYAKYSHCEFCGTAITGREYHSGAASHEECWKTWCDRGRYREEFMGSEMKAGLDRLGNMVADKPIYRDDGTRYKDYEYGELLNGH